MAELALRAVQGEAVTWTVTLSVATFEGTETLAATVSTGTTESALLTLTPTWTAGQTAGSYSQVDLSLTAVQTTGLAPGSYLVAVSLADDSAALARGTLAVYPGPGGTDVAFRRLLATPAQVRNYLPSFTQAQLDALPAALEAATEAIEGYVGRPLVLDSYDQVIRLDNGNRLRLRTRPVVEVSRVSAGMIAGCVITNTSTTVSNATVKTVTSGPGSLAITSLVLSTITNGTATTSTLALDDYSTFDGLVAAVDAVGSGWSATTADSTVGALPCSDAFGTAGVRGALNQAVSIWTHANQLYDWWLDECRGFVELADCVPGYVIYDRRSDRTDSRLSGVRVTYRAGYASLKTDADLGYRTVPADLIQACAMTAQSILESTPLAGPVSQQSVQGRQYILQKDADLIPAGVKSILARYRDLVF